MITKIKLASAKVKHFRVKVLLAVTFVLACTATTVFAATNAIPTLVCCENEITKVYTLSADPEDIVKRAGINTDEDYKLNLDSFDPEKEDSVIYVYLPHSIVVEDDGIKIDVTASGTVEDALKEAGIKIKETDKISVNREVFLRDGMIIKISRSFSVTLKADGKTRKYSLVKGTVEDLLDEAEITLGKHDKISCGTDTLLEAGMKVVVERISYDTRTEKEDIEYTTRTLYNDDWYSDKQKVNQKGVKGCRKITYLDKYVDGKCVSSLVTNEKITKQPVEEIVTVGTRYRYLSNGRPVSTSRIISQLDPPYDIELDSNGRPVNYKRVITGKATAYCTGYITSTGVAPMPGRVAVDPNQIPYGTRLYIVSADGKYVYGYAVAADTGGFVWNGSGTTVDLYMYSYSDCINFGRRSVEIYILP
ncbi:MAG: ubiquitin-like domain-containing protein [Clostridia bacterium]|nr:ubiquitin-like domain-containing protein [Clostridia bacterium]